MVWLGNGCDLWGLLCMSSDCLFDGLLSYGLVVVWFYSLGLRAIVVCI